MVEKDIKIISWNGNHGRGGDIRGFAAFQKRFVEILIDAHRDHYICLQEVKITGEFERVLKERWPEIKIVKNKEHDVAIVWRNGDECQQESHRSVGRNWDVRYIEVIFNDFVLISCHASHKDGNKEKKRRLRKFFGDKQKQYQNFETVIVAGDFNFEYDKFKESITDLADVLLPSQQACGRRQEKKKIDLLALVKTAQYCSEKYKFHSQNTILFTITPNYVQGQYNLLARNEMIKLPQGTSTMQNYDERTVYKISLKEEDIQSDFESEFCKIKAAELKAKDETDKIKEEIKDYDAMEEANSESKEEHYTYKFGYKLAKALFEESQDEYYKTRAKYGEEQAKEQKNYMTYRIDNHRYDLWKKRYSGYKAKHDEARFKNEIEEAMDRLRDIKIEQDVAKELAINEYRKRIVRFCSILDHDPILWHLQRVVPGN